MSPARRPGVMAPGLRLKLVLAFYVLAAALLPLDHHDIVCHLKSSTHCPTCTVGSAGELTSEPAVFGAFTLKDAGTVAWQVAPRIHATPRASRTGRAPPANG